MQTITDIGQEAKQKHIIITENNEQFDLELFYSSVWQGWFCNISYANGNKTLTINGTRITTHINILRQWENVLPFGLMCECDDNQEPMFIEDFASGRARLSILTPEEVKQINNLVKGV
jgi:hypothetical protein